MPFYEMILLCKMCESSAMGLLLKNVSTAILQEGGNCLTLNRCRCGAQLRESGRQNIGEELQSEGRPTFRSRQVHCGRI